MMMSLTCCFLLFFLFFFHSVKARKGSAGHKRRLEAGGHGKCRLCPVHQSNPVCGSDGHSYSSKARVASTSHARTTRFSSLHPSHSLRLSLCCLRVVGSRTRASEKDTDGPRAVHCWNWWCKQSKLFTFFSLPSSWQMRFKLSSSVTLSSSVPRPSPLHRHTTYLLIPVTVRSLERGHLSRGFWPFRDSLSVLIIDTKCIIPPGGPQHATKASWNQRRSLRQGGEKDPIVHF